MYLKKCNIRKNNEFDNIIEYIIKKSLMNIIIIDIKAFIVLII